jgi:hypothetical protein
MRLCFDLDNTICLTQGTEYSESTPIISMVDLVNLLYNQGHYVVIFTARGSKSQSDFRELTENQLKNWGVSYHELLFGKPYADIFVDDRAITAASFHNVAETFTSYENIMEHILMLVNHGHNQM